MKRLTTQDIDRLALDACEFIGWKSGATVAYDPAGFDRVERLQIQPGSLRSKDAGRPAGKKLPDQARFEEQPYTARIAGFQRRDIFGPDAIGQLIQQKQILWNDGLGNGLHESLRIDRKYGLRHVLEAPIYQPQLPFLEEEMASFVAEYAREVERFKADLREVEVIYGEPLAEKGERLMVLWCQHYPLGLFAEAYQRNPDGVEKWLLNKIGCALPPIEPRTPPERAQQARFWSLIRQKQVEAINAQAAVLRERMGKDLLIAANPHELPPLDMEGQGQVYDYPAVAIRPLLVEDELMLRHYVAFYTQLYRDLTGKPPMVSVRMNTSAASPRYIPRAGLIYEWYDQAVRHGAGAFYFWTRDYPYSDAPGVYDGPIPGNPDDSAIAGERWQAVLDRLGRVCSSRRFIPPSAQVAILIPNDSALLHRKEWRRIYAAFSAMTEGRIHTQFVSDRLIASGGVPAGVKLLIAPVLEFISDKLRSALDQFTANGGKLLVASSTVWDEVGEPDEPLKNAVCLEHGILDVFPLGQQGDRSALAHLVGVLSKQTAQAQADDQAWVFDVAVENLPVCSQSQLRETQPDVQFSAWLYEHGSPWIVPYL